MDVSFQLVALEQFNSYALESVCEKFLRPRTLPQIQDCIRKNPKIPILGGGSNVILLDPLYRQLLHLADNFSGFRFRGSSVVARSGTNMDELCKRACELGMAGLENLSGIPGTLGGAVVMNAGAFGSTIGDSLNRVNCVSRRNGKVVVLTRDQLKPSYRSTILLGDEFVVAQVYLDLKKDESRRLSAIRSGILSRRLNNYPVEPNAGSVFVRPSPKLPVGKLVEELGLKGLTIGGAEVSIKHAGFFIAREGCKGSDLLELSDLVRDAVLKGFAIKLTMEQKPVRNIDP